jgi:hypothetical protein
MPRFRGKEPKFRPSSHLRHFIDLAQSPYYWWYLFLREHDGYKRCCDNKGNGKYSKLYADFGDVHAEEFPDWWQSRGEHLFAEQVRMPCAVRLATKDDWLPSFDEYPTVVFAFDSTAGEAGIRRMFRDYMRSHLGKEVGRPPRTQRPTFARYPLSGIPKVLHLKTMYGVLQASKLIKGRSRNWRIAEGLSLKGVAKVVSASDQDRPILRKEMSDRVGGLLKEAKRLVELVGEGKFPAAYDHVPPEESKHARLWREDRDRLMAFRKVLFASRPRLVRQAR